MEGNGRRPDVPVPQLQQACEARPEDRAQDPMPLLRPPHPDQAAPVGSQEGGGAMNEDHAAMFQQQLQALLMQREQLNLQLLELKTAITELEKTAEKQVYKLAGPVLVKKPVEEVLADLKEKQELVTLRLQAIEKSETRTKERMQVLEKSPSK